MAEERRHPGDFEDPTRHEQGAEALRPLANSVVDALVIERGYAGEHAAVGKVEEVWNRKRQTARLARAVVRVHDNDTIRLGHSDWRQRCSNDAEDAGVGADAERESRNDHGGK